MRDPHGKAAERIADLGPEQLCTSIIVAAELKFGLARGASVRVTERVGQLLQTLTVAPFESPADDTYATLRARLQKIGCRISGNDLLIAAHAIAIGCTLVTDNEREFRRVTELRCENWLR